MPVCAGQHAGLCKWVDTGLMWFNTLVHEALAKFPLNTVSTKQYLRIVALSNKASGVAFFHQDCSM